MERGSYMLKCLRKETQYQGLLEELREEDLIMADPNKPKGFWSKIKNQKEFLEWMSKQLGFQTINDWHKLTHEKFIRYGGSGLLSRYGNSPSKVLLSLYPNHNWMMWKFERVPSGFWDSAKNKKLFLDWLSKELKLKQLDDWYRISVQEIRRMAPATPFRKYGGMTSVITNAYPSHPLEFGKILL